MILTRRGVAVAVVLVGGLLNAALYGPRALNAVVAPAAVALAAALVTVYRVDVPQFDRAPVEDGFVGTRRTVQLSLSADPPFTGRVVDEVSDGLWASGNELYAAIDDEQFEYDLEFSRRGEHSIGPASVTVQDVLGLASRTFEYPRRESVLVYPTIYDLGTRATQELAAIPEFRLVSMRGEFDSLREYERGDALRDIHWKSSAKRADDDLVVKEYTDEDDLGAVVVVAESAPNEAAADAMASATASIAAFLLSAGLTVGVSAPDGVVDAGEGSFQRRRMLELLARTAPGNVPRSERAEADVAVYGETDGTATVSIDGTDLPFRALAGNRPTAGAPGGGEERPAGPAGG